MKKEFSIAGTGRRYAGHLITGFLALLFLIAAGLFAVLIFRPLYYFDLSYLNIVENSGYSKEEILLNYNALIDWCMPWVQTEFSLPTFPFSANASIHFEQVKFVFDLVLAAGFLSVVPLAALMRHAKKSGDGMRFTVAGIVVLAVPVCLGAYIMQDFNRAFVLFHEIVFRNDLWIFDYRMDPVIKILPEAYFMHCAVFILIVVATGAAGLFLLGRRRKL